MTTTQTPSTDRHRRLHRDQRRRLVAVVAEGIVVSTAITAGAGGGGGVGSTTRRPPSDPGNMHRRGTPSGSRRRRPAARRRARRYAATGFANAPGSSVRTIFSLAYSLPRCVSTVFSVTNSDCAISRVPIPSAASCATRRSLGVSESIPLTAARRGRAPAAQLVAGALDQG